MTRNEYLFLKLACDLLQDDPKHQQMALRHLKEAIDEETARREPPPVKPKLVVV